jgi:hypothetical protein
MAHQTTAALWLVAVWLAAALCAGALLVGHPLLFWWLLKVGATLALLLRAVLSR